MTAVSPKVEPRHLRLLAAVYVRQSTPQQLQNNQESTRRQYGLADRARRMGWPETAVRVIDDDLGMSGASCENRTGFQRLVAAIGMGEVGIVLVTEVSRLSRLNSDWHRVIELCAVFRTLIADEDGVYDPQNPNDRLLLGVKGTLFAAELHVLQARMRGALTSKAERGELAVALPVGYRRRPDGVVVQDPDDAVRLAIAAVFERFAALGNARAVLRHFVENGLMVPRLVQARPEMGRIVWERPVYRMFHRMLANPAYAGTFVYGRCRGEITAADPPVATTRRLPPEEWSTVIEGVYPGYISHGTFLANRQKLRANRYNFAAKGRGAAREGAALLQGLAHCGRCGRQMGVSYGRQQPRYECRFAQTHRAEPMCQSFIADAIDGVVVRAFLDAVRPAGLEATLVALRELGRERGEADRLWRLRLERARYEARLAQRQYDAVDPDNRLVARELERRWEAALAEAERLAEEYERLRQTELRPLDDLEAGEVRRLASDLPALWHADTTTPVDRKRLLRLVVASVAVTVGSGRSGAEVHVLWSGGARTTYRVDSPDMGRHLRTGTHALDAIRALSSRMPDHRVAAELTAGGLRTRRGKPWTAIRVASMRRQHGIPTACPADTGGRVSRADGFIPARVAARRLGITLGAIRIWAHRGVLACDQSRAAAKLWIRLGEGDVRRVAGAADTRGMERVRDAASRCGTSVDAIWERVRRGEFDACRAPRGPGQWEWWLSPRPPQLAPTDAHLPTAGKADA
uniref:recombinase family protein n=1 Tax=uncultured Sphingomonas sp. TaxID=158754 RepID=UPI0025E5277C|nr:recombinase family protein [uncultured Sphingomonas sp.]